MNTWKDESYPGEIDQALDLFNRRNGEIHGYELQDGTLRRLENNLLTQRLPGTQRYALMQDGWAEIFRRRQTAE